MLGVLVTGCVATPEYDLTTRAPTDAVGSTDGGPADALAPDEGVVGPPDVGRDASPVDGADLGRPDGTPDAAAPDAAAPDAAAPDICVPSDEICNGADDDCDGATDEGTGGVDPRTGIEWVCVAGGSFTMGSALGEPDERRDGEVDVPAFLIARTEVTVGQYRRCVDDGGACTEPTVEACGAWPNWGVADREDHPVNCVDWAQAHSYAAWVGGGGRLPSEAEWEYAARGRGQLQTYPWGDLEPAARLAVFGGEAGTSPVCSTPDGRTAQGLCDMAGNVWEWVEDWFGSYDAAPADGSARSLQGAATGRAFRGGGCHDGAWDLRATRRAGFSPDWAQDDQGFRVARPTVPPPEPLVVPCPAPAAPPPVSTGLAGAIVRSTMSVGGPLQDAELRAGNLNGNKAGAVSFVVARGGRLERFDEDGATPWRSELLGIEAVIDAADLDGDGRLEIVARSLRAVHVFDALGGALLWSLPLAPFGDDTAIVAVETVFLVDLDGDGLPELYVTDGGCVHNGTGRGVVLSFAGSVTVPVTRAVIDVLRDDTLVNGRCTRWQAFGDVDGDHRLELLLTDGAGLQAYDPLTGARKYYGEVPDTVGDGTEPHLAFPRAGGEDRLVFDGGQVLRLGLQEGGTARAPGEPRSLRPRWRTTVGDEARAVGSGLADLDGDGILDVLTSARTGDAWRVVALSGADGSEIAALDDAWVEAVVDLDGDGRAEVVLREAPAVSALAFGALRIDHLGGAPPYLQAGPLIAGAALVRPADGRWDRVGALADPLTLGGRLVMIREVAPDAARAGAIELWTDAAAVARRALDGDVGAVRPACVAGAGCELLAVALDDGGLAVLDASLTPVDGREIPRAAAPTGSTQVEISGGELVGLSPGGRVVGLNWRDPASGPRWVVDAGPRPALQPPDVVIASGRGGENLVITRLYVEGLAAWQALDAETGALRWVSLLDEDAYIPLPPAAVVPGTDVMVRYDLVTSESAPPAPDCPIDRIEPEAFTPDADCPAELWYPRALTAIDLASGACRWRTILRPTRCRRLVRQLVSVIGDALFVTETASVRQLDPATGEVLRAAPVDPFEGGIPRSGGWVRATGGEPPLARVGGNGPLEFLNATLDLSGRAADVEGLRAQGWQGHDLVMGDGEVWIEPGFNLPLLRYPVAPVPAVSGTVGLRDGEASAGVAAHETVWPNVTAMTRVQGLLDGADGIAAVTDEGIVYGLALDGTVGWYHVFEGTLGSVRVGDLGGDGDLELIAAITDGRVVVLDDAPPPGPAGVWDLSCPPDPACDPGGDADETDSTDTLCAAWYALPDVDRYEVRVLGPNGAVIEGWRAVGSVRVATVDGLHLTPGVVYAVEVRGVRAQQPTNSASSDGVRVVNVGPPSVAVTLDRAELDLQGEPLTITVDASDDDLLAGWSLDVISEDGLVVRRLAGQPLAQPVFQGVRIWDGRDGDGDGIAVAPGVYRVVAAAIDRARNVGRDPEEKRVTVCDGPCP